MKQLIGAAILALAFTGTASAYDNYSTGGYGYDNNSYTAEKPNYAPKKYAKDIKVSEDPNPSKLKKQLQFFNEISGDH